MSNSRSRDKHIDEGSDPARSSARSSDAASTPHATPDPRSYPDVSVSLFHVEEVGRQIRPLDRYVRRACTQLRKTAAGTNHRTADDLENAWDGFRASLLEGKIVIHVHQSMGYGRAAE